MPATLLSLGSSDGDEGEKVDLQSGAGLEWEGCWGRVSRVVVEWAPHC